MQLQEGGHAYNRYHHQGAVAPTGYGYGAGYGYGLGAGLGYGLY
jgi:hypothetical protein